MKNVRWLVIGIALVAPVLATAQSTACKPDKDDNESKLLAFFAAPLTFSSSGHAGNITAGDVRVGFDVTYLPTPDAAIRTPDTCYRNDKTENTQLSSFLPRPRLIIGLADGLALEAMYLPPVTILDATPNLFSAALSYTRPLGVTRFSVSARGHATLGEVKGPITCASDVIQTTDPTGNCYATSPSEDTYKPNVVGGELAIGYAASDRLRTYVGTGFSSLRPRFQVGYVDANGVVDNQMVEVDLTRMSVFGGGSYSLGGRTALTFEVYSVPQDVTTIRVGGSFALRGAH